MKLGIVGLPNVGKSTLFNAITNAGAQSANYPFCTIEPNVGVVAVPDYRLDRLAQMYNPVKVTPATVEFVDIAGLVRGASKGEGLGNKFLSHIREVDAIVHLEMVERRIERTTKAMKGDKSLAAEVEFFKRVKQALENEKPARSVECNETEKALLDSACLLTGKKVIYACNMSEQDFTNGIDSNENYKAVCALAAEEGSEVLPICAGLEAEISSLSKEDREIFLADLGVQEGGLDLLIRKCYHLLGLISYLTAGQPEVRAWTIREGTKAPQAAGKIHSDFERGFIRAEVITFENLIECGSLAAAREKGLIRSEGKDYVMKDGDVVHFLFNV